jgi:hypothetical protein
MTVSEGRLKAAVDAGRQVTYLGEPVTVRPRTFYPENSGRGSAEVERADGSSFRVAISALKVN